MNPITRRDFLKTVAVTGAGWLGIGRAFAQTSPETLLPSHTIPPLPQRVFGKTGVRVSILGFGGASIPSTPFNQGIKTVEEAINSGINYIDTASQYGDRLSEKMIGEVMKTRRKEVFLATKTLARSYFRAHQEMTTSLKLLKTDFVDLMQIHSVNDTGTLKQVLSPQGSVPAAEKLKREGYVRFIGITGHTDPQVLRKALQEYPFTSVLIPLGAPDRFLNDFTPVVEEAQKRGIAVIAMKVFSAGKIVNRLDLSSCLRYSMGLPVCTAIVGFSSPREVQFAVEIARSFQPLSREEERSLLEAARAFATPDVLWWKK